MRTKNLFTLMLLALILSFSSNGFAKNLNDAVILHCFDWKYTTIENNLDKIAAAGYTYIQTSPVQTNNKGSNWYWLYQPYNMEVGPNKLGTVDELKNLITAAHNKGLKIIVDAVCNHVSTDGAESDFYSHCHSYTGNIDYNNRWQITHGQIGMPDLDSESDWIIAKGEAFMRSLASIGVDGVRFDAAKHIGLPSESCNWWPRITAAAPNLECYGEILDGASSSDNGTLIKEYNKYISTTDNTYGNGIRGNVSNNNFSSIGYGNLVTKGVEPANMVLWAESHDTYSNSSCQSTYTSASNINKAWALVASRKQYSALYFARPTKVGNDVISIGDAFTDDWEDAEVIAVNKFHSAMGTCAEYFVAGSNYDAVVRTKGCVIVTNGSGYINANNGGGTMTSGTYKDQITGNTFTVTSSTISGNVGSKGIAVIYNVNDPVTDGSVIVDKTTDSYNNSVSVNVKPSKSGVVVVYTTDGSNPTANSNQITDATNGKTLNFTQTTTLKAGVLKNGIVSDVKTFTYTITSEKIYTAYFDNSESNWNAVSVWVWNGDNTSTNYTGGTWPGKALSIDASTGYYKWSYTGTLSTNTKIIFNNGGKGSQTADLNFVDGAVYNIKGKTDKIIGVTDYAIVDKSTNTYKNNVDVNIKPSKAGAVVVYTTNGTEPTANSYQITDATNGKTLNFTQTTTLKAGVLNNGNVYNVKTYTYTITTEKVHSAYFDNSSTNWSAVSVWVWDGNNISTNYTGGTWPGKALSIDTSTGYYKWSYTGNLSSNTKIIFNNGGRGCQTADLNFVDGAIYNSNGLTNNTICSNGINNISANTENAAIKVYTISGVCAATIHNLSEMEYTLRPGIYIINGKKYTVK